MVNNKKIKTKNNDENSQALKNQTTPTTPLIVKLERLTPKNAKIPTKRMEDSPGQIPPLKKQLFEPRTPKPPIEFSLELKKAINERNILTTKTKKRVFDALDEINVKNLTESRKLKRDKVLSEIIDSERNYLNQLEIVINFFMKPMLEKKLLKQDDYNVLFGNINTIYNINTKLKEELDQGFKNVPAAFLKIAPFLKIYSVYACEFKNVIKLLQNARSNNPRFADFVEGQESRPEIQNKLSALLITPIQRVPRYKLLLSQLEELTNPSENEYKVLVECLKRIEEAAEHINKIIEEQENQQRLLELQRCLKSGEPSIITPGRSFKKDGVLSKMSSKNSHSEKLYVVLMNDIIMFNKMKRDKPVVNSLKCCCIFPLNKCKVVEMLDKGCFKLMCQQEELILYHNQFEETKQWISTITTCIDKYLDDRKTLRKESSSRRPVKRKDVNEYNEVGLSPGQPLKKRKIFTSETEEQSKSSRVMARKPIRSVLFDSISKYEQSETNDNNYCAAMIPDVTVPADPVESDNNAVFVFGKPQQHNNTGIKTFLGGVTNVMKRFFGFRS